jgi:arabinose-5-phosphate isomerase
MRQTGTDVMAADPQAAGGKPAPAAEIGSAQRTISLEAAGLNSLAAAMRGPLGEAFSESLAVLKQATGRVIVSGMGKSGHIGRKIASTLASTGRPALYLHPAEASHGDLGMITPEDVLLVLSWSGETPELRDLVAYSRRFSVTLIAITSNAQSTLGKSADIVLALPVQQEACPNGLAPTTSTTMQLVIGDALAVALLEDKGFSSSDFSMLHPGGRLGAALSFVRDFMRTGEDIPLLPEATGMAQALVTMSEKNLGCLGITGDGGRLIGIITDGDLRRHMSDNLLQAQVREIMTADPKTITPGELASSALEQINNSSITSLFVVDDGKPIGIVHIHDLLRAGVA